MEDTIQLDFKDNPYTTDNFDMRTNKALAWNKFTVKFVDYPTKKNDGEIMVTTNGPWLNPLSDNETFDTRISLYDKDGNFLRSVFLETCQIEDVSLPRLGYSEPRELVSDIQVSYRRATEQGPGVDDRKAMEFVG